jgi:hypothetical protein
MHVRGTLLRILAGGFASSFWLDFPGDSSESSCFFTEAEPFGVFMTSAGEMGEEGRERGRDRAGYLPSQGGAPQVVLV